MAGAFGTEGASSSVPNLGQAPRAAWTVPRNYKLPRRVVNRSLEALDLQDSPDRPGMMYESTIKDMVKRFDDIFADKSEAAVKEREQTVAAALLHLRRHTRRRRGEAVIQEGLIEWEQTSRVYDLFAVQLNIFERIFFTVDVTESTSVLSRFVSTFLVVMIFISMILWMISTLPHEPFRQIPAGCTGLEIGDCAPKPATEFLIFEQISVMVFTAEYLVRLLTVHSVRFELLDGSFLEGVLAAGALKGSASNYSRLRGGMTTLLKGAGSPTAATGNRITRGSLFSEPSARRSASQTFHKLDGKIATTLKHILSPANLIDLLAVLPFWIEVIQGSKDSEGGAMMVLRILRLTRIFRVFKLGKYSEVFSLFNRVMNQSMPALLLMLFFIWLAGCLFGTLIWFCEQGTWYPRGHAELLHLGIMDRGAYLRSLAMGTDTDRFEESPFRSILHSFWYVVVTITTVGYGDMYPTSSEGKAVAITAILNGIIVLAMPIGVVGANFSQEYYRVLDEKKRRARMREQLLTQAAVEAQQDSALINEALEDVDQADPKVEGDATELRRVDSARQLILNRAEDIDRICMEQLGERSHVCCAKLRQFVCNLLCSEAMKAEGVILTSAPVVSQSVLIELDGITSLLHETIAACTSVERDADFGLAEARDLRRCWHVFVDACWKYVVEMCRVEKPSDPPEYFELKALMASTDTRERAATASRELSGGFRSHASDSGAPSDSGMPLAVGRRPPLAEDLNELPGQVKPMVDAARTP